MSIGSEHQGPRSRSSGKDGDRPTRTSPTDHQQSTTDRVAPETRCSAETPSAHTESKQRGIRSQSCRSRERMQQCECPYDSSSRAATVSRSCSERLGRQFCGSISSPRRACGSTRAVQARAGLAGADDRPGHLSISAEAVGESSPDDTVGTHGLQVQPSRSACSVRPCAGRPGSLPVIRDSPVPLSRYRKTVWPGRRPGPGRHRVRVAGMEDAVRSPRPHASPSGTVRVRFGQASGYRLTA